MYLYFAAQQLKKFAHSSSINLKKYKEKSNIQQHFRTYSAFPLNEYLLIRTNILRQYTFKWQLHVHF